MDGSWLKLYAFFGTYSKIQTLSEGPGNPQKHFCCINVKFVKFRSHEAKMKRQVCRLFFVIYIIYFSFKFGLLKNIFIEELKNHF